MRLDGRKVSSAGLSADLCIIGAGAAGITLAKELLESGLDVLLVESGGVGRSRAAQTLNQGHFHSNYLPDDLPYLTASRVRGLGGSTAHWGGNCHPLDPLDLETRPWVPHSGWPVTWGELSPYYLRATPYVDVSAFPDPDVASALLAEDAERMPLPLTAGPFAGAPEAPDQVRTLRYHLSKPTRFGPRYRDELFAAPRLRVLLNASVLRLETDRGGGSVQQAQAAVLGGRRFPIRARRWVLATGGIENARLLLLSSNPGHLAGLGNNEDLVGRYFHDHVMAERSLVFINRPAARMGLYRPGMHRDLGHRVHGLLALTPDAQRDRGLMNLGGELRRTNPRSLTPTEAAMLGAVRRLADSRTPAAWPGPEAKSGQVFLARMQLYGEQQPHPNNRVQLAQTVDALGQRQVHLEWNVRPADEETLMRGLRLMGQALGAAGLGRLSLGIPPAPRRRGDTPIGGGHHMGSTRMAASPRQGVVDADCRVHGLRNLYVAGSSVFPTGGFVPPTLTIVALAIRLADALQRQGAA